MKRAPSTFRQQDVTRALRAAIAAGLQMAGFKIGAQGQIEVVIGDSRAQDLGGERREANEWDRV